MHLDNFKGLSRISDGRILSKNLGASLFNDDLLNEPTFGRIHLAGQYLKELFEQMAFVKARPNQT